MLPVTAAGCLVVLGLILLVPPAVPEPPAPLAIMDWPFQPASPAGTEPLAMTVIERITPDAGPAASTAPDGREEDAKPVVTAARPLPSAPEGYDPLVLQQIADELGARSAALDRRAREVDGRTAALAQVEQRIAEQLTRFEGLRDTLQGLVEDLSKDEEARLARVVKVYEGMKAKSAAPIIQDLDPALALRVLRRMREPKVAAIVAEMAASKARMLTAALALPADLPTLP